MTFVGQLPRNGKPLSGSQCSERLSATYLLTFKPEGEAETRVEHHCAASIGAVLFDSEAGTEDIIKRADIAMYQAKDAGRNVVHFMIEDMTYE